MTRALLLAAIVVVSVTWGHRVSTAQLSSPNAQAQEFFRSGLEFAQRKLHDQALKDFETVEQTYPQTRWAPSAMYESARIRFEVFGDVAAARDVLERATTRYPGGDVKPWWDILDARLRMAASGNDADVQTAMNDLERVLRVFQGSASVPAALFYLAEADRQGGRYAQARARFAQLARDHSQSVWAARAHLGQAAVNLAEGRNLEALELVQRVIDRFPGSEEAATARHWSTALARLHARVSGSPYRMVRTLSSPGAGADIRSMAVTPGGQLFVATARGVFVTSTGEEAYTVAGQEEGVSVAARGQVFLFSTTGFRQLGGAPVAVSLPRLPERSSRPRELLEGIAALAVTSTQDFLLADRRRRGVYRQGRGPDADTWLTDVQARRLAINMDDEVALLTAEGRIDLYNRFGRPRSLSLQGSGRDRFRDPRDVAFDGMGHLYVLDRGHRSVLVFSPNGRFLRSFDSATDREPHAFTRAGALAVDQAGTLYILDERNRQIQVYQ